MEFWQQWIPLANQVVDSLPEVTPDRQKYALAQTFAHTFRKGATHFAHGFVHAMKKFRDDADPADRVQGGPLDGASVHMMCEAVIDLVQSYAADNDKAAEEGYQDDGDE
jgi:hypothetical protein